MMRRTILQGRSILSSQSTKTSLIRSAPIQRQFSTKNHFQNRQITPVIVPASSFSSFNNGYSSPNQGFPPPPGQQVQAAQTQDHSIELGDDVVAAVSQFKGVVLLHIRRYFYNKANKRTPGKEGVTLRTSDVNKLEEFFDDIDGDLRRVSGEIGHVSARAPVVLSQNRQVEVIVRDSLPEVVFIQNGEPPRTIALNVDQYNSLKQHMPILKEYIASLSGTIASNSTALELDLSQYIKARVIKFSTGYFVDLRKSVPSKDGQSQPAKVGIALTPQQWKVIEENYQNIHNALYQGNLDYSLELSPLRKVTLSYFKQNWTVAIREYYRDPTSNELKFGRKGINLNVEEWNNLYNTVPQLSEALKNSLANAANETPTLQTEYFAEHPEN